MNTFLDLREKLTTSQQLSCPKHNDPLKVYCETCLQVICRDCTISEEHKMHEYHLISECFPKHLQLIQTTLDSIKEKIAHFDTAVTNIDTRKKEVIQQGQELKSQIQRHAQQIIDQVQESSTCLSQEVDNIVQQKIMLLTKQMKEAQKLLTRLQTCQESIASSLKEWTQQEILMKKYSMINKMITATRHTDPGVLQPIEQTNIRFTPITAFKPNSVIGLVTSTTFGKYILSPPLILPNRTLTAALSLMSKTGLPIDVPPSLISSKINCSTGKHSTKCEITQTHKGNYNITCKPFTEMCAHGLKVQIGGIDLKNTPVSLPARLNVTTTQMRVPCGIAVRNNGDIVVIEWGAHCVTVMDKEGNKIRSFGTKGTKEGQFTFPLAVAISADGHILVTDKHRLQKLTTTGVCIKSTSNNTSISAQPQFFYPQGIAVHSTGQIFVADSGNNRIQVFTNDLTFSKYITTPSNNNRQFNCPFGLALDNHGCLYIAEWSTHCITVLTIKGEYIKTFGSMGTAPGHLYYPSSITTNNNLVFVSESGNDRISVFHTDGKFICCFDTSFKRPQSLAINTSTNQLYVSDSSNGRIVVFQ